MQLYITTSPIIQFKQFMGVTPFQAMYQCRGLSWEAGGDRAAE